MATTSCILTVLLNLYSSDIMTAKQTHTVVKQLKNGLTIYLLSFFGHLAHTALKEDHHRVIAATLRPPADWRWPVGRPRTTWLRTIDDDLQSLNFGVHTA